MSDFDFSKFVGTTINGKYDIIRQLGAGGMGVVFQAHHAFMDKPVAIKMLSAELANDDTAFKRFQAEARAAAALNHTNIIRVYDLDVSSDGYPFIVMDYLEGRSLDQILTRQKTLKWQRAVPLFIKICEALAHAHSRKIVHRDIKPSNIMIVQDDDGDEFPIVVDFGLAKLYDKSGYQRGPKLTQTGQVFGTCLYMSPEQCNAQDLDGRSDMYSFGCVMYEVLTGESPFLRENFVQTVMAHINEEAMPIEQLVPQAVNPTKLHDIIHKCMRKNIGDRYPSMTEVIEDLSSIMRRGKERSQTMISTSTDSAERKSGPSQAEINYELGCSFEEKGDDAQALVYYMRAAERGHAISQYFVGRAYYWGFGVEPDLDQAIAWYRKSANGGVINAVLELFNCLIMKNTPEDDKEAYYCITTAANSGFAPAQYEFGRTFKEGLFGAPSMAEALNWFSKAAEQNYAPALVALGEFYEDGIMVAKDLGLAVQLYRAAADQDYGPGAFKIYECYLQGKGLPQNDASSLKWLDRAASAGHGPAMLRLEGWYRHGIIVQQDIQRADAYRKDALNQCRASELYDYAMELNKLGLSKQDAEAYLQVAAERGYEKAKALLR